MKTQEIQSVLLDSTISKELKNIAEKIYASERITFDEGVLLFKKGEVGFLGTLAN